jgi:hypothetical protein
VRPVPPTQRQLGRPSQLRELNLHAMRTGPGKHLKGLTLMGGIIKPEEVRLCF